LYRAATGPQPLPGARSFALTDPDA